jgi:hypothetical protein
MRSVTLFAALFMCVLFGKAQSSRIWSTYYGSSGTEECYSTAVDTFGNVYVAGSTASTSGFSSNGFQNTYGGGSEDAFLVKFDSSGNRLWATYYGGIDQDIGYDVATDLSGNVYLAGYTLSQNNIASGGFQNSYRDNGEAFLVKFSASGSRLWATYFGDSLVDEGDNVETDALGNVYLSGFTSSDSGIAYNGFQNVIGGGTYDGFLAKFNAAGNLMWSTYYGGPGNDNAYGLCTSPSGDVYIGGQTNSTWGIASSGFQNTIGGGFDAYLAKFTSTGIRLWSTYYGGSGGETAWSTAVDPAGNIFLSGTTLSTTGI